MANFNVDSFINNIREAENLDELVQEAFIKQGKINDYVKIESGVSMGQQIPFASKPSLQGQAITGCDIPEDNLNIVFTNKTYNPVNVGGKIPICADDLPRQLKIFGQSATAKDLYDIQDSPQVAYMVNMLGEAIVDMMFRLVYFGDTTATNVSNSETPGHISDAYNVKYFTPFDGLFKQWILQTPTSASNYVEITENTKSSYAEQNNLTSDKAFTIFKSMVQKLSLEARQLKNSGVTYEIHATTGLVDNYKEYLRTTNSNFSMQYLEKGINQLYFDNYKVVERLDWTNSIDLYENDGVKLNGPHRAKLDFKENNVLATESETFFDKIKVHYSDDLNKVFLTHASKIDVKTIRPELSVIAY